jgi:hypothetical protein
LSKTISILIVNEIVQCIQATDETKSTIYFIRIFVFDNCYVRFLQNVLVQPERN